MQKIGIGEERREGGFKWLVAVEYFAAFFGSSAVVNFGVQSVLHFTFLSLS